MYKSNLTNAIADYNRNNPTLRKLTLTSIAKQIGCSQPYLSGIGKSQTFQYYFGIILEIDKNKEIKKRWQIYNHLEIPCLTRLEAIRKILGCEIYDLIKKV